MALTDKGLDCTHAEEQSGESSRAHSSKKELHGVNTITSSRTLYRVRLDLRYSGNEAGA